MKNYGQVVLAYIDYYHLRASRCKYCFYVFNLIKIVLISILPVLQVAGIATCIPWIVTACSSGVLIIESVLELWRLKEKWILYRSTCNRLMSVQRQHMAKKDNSDEEMKEYIAQIEAIINGEGDRWVEVSKDKGEKKDNSGDSGQSE